MTIPSARQLFDQAARLAAPPPAGSPRQVDLRRAISSSYYALFHFMLMSVADEFVGVAQRASPRYALVYRSIAHRTLKDICTEAARGTPSARFAALTPVPGFDEHIKGFAAIAIELQERRHAADYDPLPRFKSSDAKGAVDLGRNAVHRFPQADQEHRRMFLTMLLCPPR